MFAEIWHARVAQALVPAASTLVPRPFSAARRIGSCALVSVFILALSAFLAAQQRPQPSYRVNVRLVRVLTTVRDRAGGLIAGLNKEDFTIFDNGVPQQISVFERRTEQPLSISLMVDTSSSTAGDLRYELDSMGKFLKALLREGNPDDSAALFSFDYNVTKQCGFTHRFSTLEQTLKKIKGTGATSLYDALYLGAKEVAFRDGRHVIVVVTDGGDTTSTMNFHQALEQAQLADAVIYPILVVPITNDAGRNLGGENALAAMAAGTGGRVFRPIVGPTLDAAFSDILIELRTQYLLGYYPKNVPLKKDPFHRLEVKVRLPDLRAVTRNGYYGEFGND
jgi:Ca-activated chloride channel family protein